MTKPKIIKPYAYIYAMYCEYILLQKIFFKNFKKIIMHENQRGKGERVWRDFHGQSLRESDNLKCKDNEGLPLPAMTE